jgi:hypothetical protein
VLEFNAGANSRAADNISFGIPLASNPTAPFIAIGDPVPAGCAGDSDNPRASPGHPWVFEGYREGSLAPAEVSIYRTEGELAPEASGKAGAMIVVYSSGADQTPWGLSGSWAVTAP